MSVCVSMANYPHNSKGSSSSLECFIEPIRKELVKRTIIEPKYSSFVSNKYRRNIEDVPSQSVHSILESTEEILPPSTSSGGSATRKRMRVRMSSCCGEGGSGEEHICYDIKQDKNSPSTNMKSIKIRVEDGSAEQFEPQPTVTTTTTTTDSDDRVNNCREDINIFNSNLNSDEDLFGNITEWLRELEEQDLLERIAWIPSTSYRRSVRNKNHHHRLSNQPSDHCDEEVYASSTAYTVIGTPDSSNTLETGMTWPTFPEERPVSNLSTTVEPDLAEYHRRQCARKSHRTQRRYKRFIEQQPVVWETTANSVLSPVSDYVHNVGIVDSYPSGSNIIRVTEEQRVEPVSTQNTSTIEQASFDELNEIFIVYFDGKRVKYNWNSNTSIESGTDESLLEMENYTMEIDRLRRMIFTRKNDPIVFVYAYGEESLKRAQLALEVRNCTYTTTPMFSSIVDFISYLNTLL